MIGLYDMMYNLVDLTDKKIVVIGASSGIGRETAILLSKLGAQLILVARRKDELIKTLDMMEKEKEHTYFEADLTILDKIDVLIGKIVEKMGALDGLVFCAGIGGNFPLKSLNPNRVDSMMRINLEAFIETVRCVTMRNRYNKGMRIVGVSSVASFSGEKAHTIYSATKAGMDGAVRCMAYELGNKGICINTVAPSIILTEMTKDYLSDDNNVLKTINKQYLGVGYPINVANGIAFLLSPAARFITGICMPIDGGYLSI